MKNIVVEEVEVEIDDKEGTDMLAEVFAFNDLSHQVIWYFWREAEMNTTVLGPRIRVRLRAVARVLVKVVD